MAKTTIITIAVRAPLDLLPSGVCVVEGGVVVVVVVAKSVMLISKLYF